MTRIRLFSTRLKKKAGFLLIKHSPDRILASGVRRKALIVKRFKEF
jgi:hypothetical protein